MRVILNTAPLLLQKSGIGYYIHNLYQGLLKSKEVEVYPTINISSLKTISCMSKAAQLLRRLFGDTILKVSIPAGDFLISKAERKRGLPSADLYHEANYDMIPAGTWKTVANIHDLTFLHHPEFVPEKVLEKCRKNLENISKADRFITNTHAIKKEVINHLKISEEQIDVIPHGPSGDYHPVNKNSDEGKKYLRKYTESDYILCVGTVEPRKNIPCLIKAFKILRESYNIKLVIAGGKGWSCDDVLKLPHTLGIQDEIIFTGYVSEKTILYLYNYATVVVYPSIYEGFGLPVIEAMSCGTPVIISDIPSLKEVAGDAALIFNPTNYEELAYKMDILLSSEVLRKELSEKSLEKGKQYSWRKTIELTIQTYKKSLVQ
jgi:glycosyltransferase involved in cell wall biosynthesis